MRQPGDRQVLRARLLVLVIRASDALVSPYDHPGSSRLTLLRALTLRDQEHQRQVPPTRVAAGRDRRSCH